MIAMRTCLGCRAVVAQSELLRLVSVDGLLVDATKPRLPGRGGYLHPDPACLAAALRRHAFRRAFGAGAQVSDEVVARVHAGPAGWNEPSTAG